MKIYVLVEGRMRRSSVCLGSFLVGLGNQNRYFFKKETLLLFCYFAHGWVLALTNKELCEEYLETNGPFPFFRNLERKLNDKDNNLLKEPLIVDRRMTYLEPFSALEIDIVKRVFDFYKDMTESELYELATEKNSPWYEINYDFVDYGYKEIPEYFIKRCFLKYKNDERHKKLMKSFSEM